MKKQSQFNIELNQMLDEAFENSKKKVDPKEYKKYDDILSSHQELARFYRKELRYLKKKNSQEIVSVTYTKGGETMFHRGYYCPSLVHTYIVEGTKRGKLLKRFSKKYSFKYGFDKLGKLIYVQNNDEFEQFKGSQFQEFITYDKNIEIGISVRPDNSICMITRCEYEDGKLLKYERSDFEMPEVYIEEYSYNDNQLVGVETASYTPSICLYNRQKYAVRQNSNGEIVYLRGGFLFNGKWQNDEYIFD
ncbi:hypothetical protein [Viridibacillus arvi]|uniref:hypothetical protein n=1 Tax=Viridibacillus arvi TaxID=263475 RepID=UPI003CFE1E31